MRDVYHIQCANDEAASLLFTTLKTGRAFALATEAYLSPSYHPSLPAYVVVIQPADTDATSLQLQGARLVGRLDDQDHFTPVADGDDPAEETPEEADDEPEEGPGY